MTVFQSLPEVAEMKIPVFTVLKNGAILKNIFIVNKSPEPESLSSSSSVQDHDHQDHILIVGRHPDCNILLTHPSISRFHLQIRSNHCSQKLIVLDLSSVHGTWVSGRKIEAGVFVEMKEGDTLRVGASSRLYRLHWIPISRAYDLDNPFVSALDVAVKAEKGQEDDAFPEEEEEKEMTQNLSCCPVHNEEVQSIDSIVESIKCLFTDWNLEFVVKKEVRSEDRISLYCNEEENCPTDDLEDKTTSESFFRTEKSYLPISSMGENKVCGTDLQVLLPSRVESVFGCGDPNTNSKRPQEMPNFSVNAESFFLVGEEYQAYSGAEFPKETNILSALGDYLRESICLPVVEAVQGTKIQKVQDVQEKAPSDRFTSQLLPVEQEVPFEKHRSNKVSNLNPASCDVTDEAVAAEMPKETGSGCTLRDNDRERDIMTTGAENLITDNTFFPVGEATQETKFQPAEVVLVSESSSKKQIICCHDLESNFQPYWNSIRCNEQGHSLDGIIQDVGDKCNNNTSLISLPEGSSITPLSEEPIMEISKKKENQTLQSHNAMVGCSEITILEKSVETKFHPIEVALGSLSGSEKHINCYQDQSNCQPYQNSISCNVQGHSMDGIVQDVRDKCNNNTSFITLPAESSITSLSGESIMEIANEKENQTQTLNAMARCSEKKILGKSPESIENNFMCSNIWSRRGKATTAPQIRTSKSQIKNAASVDNEVEMSYQRVIKEKVKAKNLLSVLGGEEKEIFTPNKENLSPNTLQLRFQKKGKLETIKHYKPRQRSHNSENHLSPEIYLGEISISETENQTPEVVQQKKSETKPFGSYIKLEQNAIDMSNKKDITDKTVQKNILAELDDEEDEYHTLDKKNFSSNKKDISDKTVQKSILAEFDEEEDEYHTPDKENFSPNTLQSLLLEKKGKLDVSGLHSSNDNFSSNTTSGKENQTSTVARGQKSKRRPFANCIELEQEQDALAPENRLERLPLQTLLANSRGKSRPETSRSVFAAEHIRANTCAQTLDMRNNASLVSERTWNMVVDTASLVNKESRKALMRLEGLKGTRLIIPKIVIKELDSMKRQFSFFRRTSEASLALEWIEECMMKSKSWIHVQNSIEEGMLIAPTPPAIPPTQFNEEDWNFKLSFHNSSMEIVSPTAEDHILDYVLTYRRQNDGQFVLLSDDVTLKIKSMAEGLLCETVEEFRDSLVNPFSERFLWANSSPRGQTWSCQDDVVLREKYCRLPSRKSSKGEGAKGLKLILLHNSRYGRLNSAR